jgi:hypothetical protein
LIQAVVRSGLEAAIKTILEYFSMYGSLGPGGHHSGPVTVERVQEGERGRNEVRRDLSPTDQVRNGQKQKRLVREAALSSFANWLTSRQLTDDFGIRPQPGHGCRPASAPPASRPWKNARFEALLI